MKPSMKVGVYNTYLLLSREGELASIKLATCECAAGYVINVYYICDYLKKLTVSKSIVYTAT